MLRLLLFLIVSLLKIKCYVADVVCKDDLQTRFYIYLIRLYLILDLIVCSNSYNYLYCSAY